MVARPFESVFADLPPALTVEPLTGSGSATRKVTAVFFEPLILDGDAVSSSPASTWVCQCALPLVLPNSATMSSLPDWAFPAIRYAESWPGGAPTLTAGPNLFAARFERRAKTWLWGPCSIQKTQIRPSGSAARLTMWSCWLEPTTNDFEPGTRHSRTLVVIGEPPP